MRNIFINQESEKTFRKQGYVVLPGLISQQELNELEEYYHSLALENRNGFHVSNYGTSSEIKRAVSARIRNVLGKKMGALLYNYTPLVGFYYVKEANETEDFYVHLDWNMVNESNYSSLAAWVPVTDVSEQNGTLVMLEASHCEPIRFRGSPGFCFPEYDMSVLKQKYRVQKLNLKAGDAVVWTHRMFHGSLQNKSGRTRIAVSQILVPEETSPFLLHLNEDKSVDVFETSEEFFCEFNPGEKPAEKYLIRIVADVNHLPSADL